MDELRPTTGLQEYVCPEMEVLPITVFCPKQIAVLEPALAGGRGFIDTVTEFVFVQPVAEIVSVKVYVVVLVGLAVGLELVDELKAVEGFHE